MKKGRRDQHCPPFVRLGKELLFNRREWWDLSPRAHNLYLLLKGKFNGQNNGKLKLYYSEVQKLEIRGLKSPESISRGFAELERKGWIARAKIGGLHRFVNEYGLTGRFDCFT